MAHEGNKKVAQDSGIDTPFPIPQQGGDVVNSLLFFHALRGGGLHKKTQPPAKTDAQRVEEISGMLQMSEKQKEWYARERPTSTIRSPIGGVL